VVEAADEGQGEDAVVIGYNGSHTHLALDKDAPEPRVLESVRV
jgi:hypothetical protein